MAQQGVENVRRNWSQRVREATGGAEDLKGKPFWTAAGLVLASTLVAACADEAKERAQRRADKANRPAPKPGPTLRFEEWLAMRSNAKVYHPQPIPGVVHEPRVLRPKSGRTWVAGNQVADSATGDLFVIPYTYGRSPPHFTLSNKNRSTAWIEGTYLSHRFDDGKVLVFEITSASAKGQPEWEFEPDRVARFFRAYIDRTVTHPPEVVVVDARAYFTPSDIEDQYR